MPVLGVLGGLVTYRAGHGNNTTYYLGPVVLGGLVDGPGRAPWEQYRARVMSESLPDSPRLTSRQIGQSVPVTGGLTSSGAFGNKSEPESCADRRPIVLG